MKQIKHPKKRKYTGRILLGFLVILGRYQRNKKVAFTAEIKISQGDTIQKILQPLSSRNKTRVKMYIRSHTIDFSKLEPGNYIFSGSYTRSNLIETILAGPTNKYQRITILEGRSIYDIDNALTKKGLITPGDYLKFVSDPTIISKYQAKYPFLQNSTLSIQHSTLGNLEGFLYPDTYNVDGDNTIDQLVYLQLEAFKSKVYLPHQQEIAGQGDNRYSTLILASVVEKEERNIANKGTVAGIFIKRLQNNMRLDADITLCYGLQQPYETCTPSLIGKNISDTTNPYNTRQQKGLPPQPIANPSVQSIVAALNPQASEYLFYLHGKDGVIHYGRTVDEHNQNKVNYLQ
jgi:UPF0755 protein